jgi:hypothetical protein
MRNGESPGGGQDEIQRVLAEVAEKFIDRLVVQISELQQFRAEFTSRGSLLDPGCVHYEAHKMCGIARTLGFGPVGDAAAQLEEVTSPEFWGGHDFSRSLVLNSVDALIFEIRIAQTPKTL